MDILADIDVGGGELVTVLVIVLLVLLVLVIARRI